MQRATTLAIFDLDHTLISTDSSARWTDYMLEQGWISDPEFREKHVKLMRQYDLGELDLMSYLRLTLAPIKGRNVSEIEAAAREFVREQLSQHVYPAAVDLLNWHRAQGHQLLLISASEYFVVQPWAELLGFEHAIGVSLEVENNCFTGEGGAVISFREGKVTALQNWLKTHPAEIERSYFYSDSHNDLPLLEHVTHPVATNPNALLLEQAQQRGWPLLDLLQPFQEPT